ncbi:Hypothetical protein PHPALM_14740 [Phytophthora palmivora]|uniref:Uncharacterized protein n=1 Tax=Phytophthora palmivora TaxID=4796 RepID=A0A2P4XU09_9STRA|nr:Hypothetical protein PHPALM_14740 [Phytophthora palmivora]
MEKQLLSVLRARCYMGKLYTANLEQIRTGDLYVGDNEYTESGHRVRVVSTSQLEAVHSKLSKLLNRIVSIQVGMRILGIFICKMILVLFTVSIINLVLVLITA